MIIKLILIAGVLGAGWMLYSGPGSSTQRAMRRLVALGVATMGVFFILTPAAVTWMANAVGVGRGTDLVLYAAVVAFGFVAVGIYQRMYAMEKRVETLTRELALRGARHPESAHDDG